MFEKLKNLINEFLHQETFQANFDKVLKTINYPEKEELAEYSITQIIKIVDKQKKIQEKLLKQNSLTQEIIK